MQGRCPGSLWGPQTEVGTRWHHRRVDLSASERFWEKVPGRPDDPAACWWWCGALTPAGYGRFWLGEHQVVAAHRWSWTQAHDTPVPDGLVVSHRCDEPSCVRPDHLEVATQSDNLVQAVRRGRASSWTRHPVAGDVRGPGGRARAIRTAVLAGASDDELEGVIAAGRLWPGQFTLFDQA